MSEIRLNPMILSERETLLRALRVSVCALGLAIAITPPVLTSIALTSGAALAAEDDEEPEETFDQKLKRNLLSGLGAIGPEGKGIEYRERSPLVVPPRLDLPPPEKNRAAVPNWPKDPDVAERKARREASKKEYKWDENRSLSPSELNVGGQAKIRATTGSVQPGNPDDGPRRLAPSELGSTNFFSKLMNKKSEEVAPFKGEPTREDLTQPPSGYQTPSPNYAYGLTEAPKAAPNNNNVVLSPSQLR